MAESSPSPEQKLSGRLLLADPSLHDGIFNRSVILIAEHDQTDGAIGLVLNHPSGKMVGELLKDDLFAPLSHVQVHVGGPVSKESMTFAAFWEEDNRFKFAARISAEEAIDHAHTPGTLVRAFIGYTGWSGEQLENELEQNSWFTTGIPDFLLGQTHDRDLWKVILRQMSPYHRILANAPENILAN